MRPFSRWLRRQPHSAAPEPFAKSKSLETALRSENALRASQIKVFADLKSGHRVYVIAGGRRILFTVDRHGNTKFKSGKGGKTEIEAIRLQVQARAQYLLG